MYAVFVAGSRQFKVKEGETLVIDRVPGNEGDKVTFSNVLMVGGASPQIGTPMVSGASVTATIKKQSRADTILVFKYKRRKNYKRMYGHRQPQSVLEINSIKA